MGTDTRSVAISQNQHYIKTIAEVLLLCSKQEIALRGYRESSDSMNWDKFFLEILNLIGEHDPIVKHRIMHGPKNATYTSPGIQNTLLNIMAKSKMRYVMLLNKLEFTQYWPMNAKTVARLNNWQLSFSMLTSTQLHNMSAF